MGTSRGLPDPATRGGIHFGHHPAIGPQDKRPRKPFQMNSVSITGSFMKINYLRDVYRREPFGCRQKVRGRVSGTIQLSFESRGPSPAFRTFKCASLLLSDRCFKPVTCFVRISFVRAALALFSADVDDRGQSAFKSPSAVFGNEGAGDGPSQAPRVTLKCALELRRRANLYSFAPSFLHPPVYSFSG